MNDETLKRRRPPPTAYDDPVADTMGAIELLATKIEQASNRIAAAIEKLAEAMPRLSNSEEN